MNKKQRKTYDAIFAKPIRHIHKLNLKSIFIMKTSKLNLCPLPLFLGEMYFT
jgi:hypothetical protein